MRQKQFKFIVPLVTFFICILLIEIFLTFYYKKNDHYYIWKPHLKYAYNLNNIFLDGVSEYAMSKYNSIGARSDELPKNPAHKILVFGGSTTQCITLDQSETWTNLLQNYLNEENDSIPFWVGNFGKSSNNTKHHILQVKEMLKNKHLQDAKTVIFLVGFNDLVLSLQNSDVYFNYPETKLNLTAFMVIPDKNLPLYRRTSIWKFLKDMNFKIRLKSYSKKRLEKAIKEERLKKANAKKINKLPDLNSNLELYSKNIKTLIQLCKSNGKTPVFVTQPVLWRKNLSQKGEGMLHTNFFNEKILSTELLAKCMEMFNETMINVCKEKNVNYIDIYSHSKENWFYDDCHYNVKGSKEISKILSHEIKPLLK